MFRSGDGHGVIWRLERLQPWLGSTGSAFGGLAVMCCIGWTGLASFLPTLGLGFLIYTANAERLIYLARPSPAWVSGSPGADTAACGRSQWLPSAPGCCYTLSITPST